MKYKSVFWTNYQWKQQQRDIFVYASEQKYLFADFFNI